MKELIEDTEPIVLFEVHKNPSGGEVVQISIAEFNGHCGLDVRAYYRRKDGSYSRSRKGIRLNPYTWNILLPEIAKAVATMEAAP